MPGWVSTLEGGPADGDKATTDIEPPERLWVSWCKLHDQWHWYPDHVEGAERYSKLETNFAALTVRYVYEDLMDTLPLQTGREREPITA